ncbi:MAG: PEP-CTERM system histidine kinase PrsK [candidate division Zixibacteria bacterium]|nr:PEP-CTERM system histidine kinase PrsK [candidate division Zixibacteria bacterium]
MNSIQGFNLWFIIGSIGAFFSLLFGFRGFFTKPKRTNYIPAAVSLAILQFGLALLYIKGGLLAKELAVLHMAVGFWLVPPLWTRFSLIFGRDEPSLKVKTWKSYLWLVSIGGFLLFIWFLIAAGKSFEIIDTGFNLAPGTIGYFLYILITSAIILVHLENTFRSADRTQKSSTGLMLFFVGMIFAMLIYISSQGLIYNRLTMDSLKSLSMVSCIASIGIFLQAGKKGIFTVKVNLTRKTIYSSAVFFLLGLYLLVIGIVAKVVQYSGGSLELFISAVAGFLVVLVLLIVLVSQSVQLRAKQVVDKYFTPDRFDYRKQWSTFSESIASILTLDELIQLTTNNLNSIFRPDKILVMLSDEDEECFTIFSNTKTNFMISGKGKLADFLFRSAGPINMNWIINDLTLLPEIEPLIAQNGKFEICLPLVAQQKVTGIMFIGARRGDEKYSEEDYSFLDTWGHQLAVAILQVRSAENLAEARELQSYHRLSTFVVHDLKNAVSMLSLLLKNAEKNISKPEFQTEAMKTISGAVNKMAVVISKFSSPAQQLNIRKTLFPASHPVDEVIKTSQIDRITQIDFSFEYAEEFSVNSDFNIIDKILSNMIVNAIEAQNGKGAIDVVVKTEKESVIYSVSDKGPGMSQDFIQRKLFKPFETTKKKGLGIGMYQCKEMAKALGGELKVESEIGNGSTFFLVLPESLA